MTSSRCFFNRSPDGKIDNQRFEHVKSLLEIQRKDATIWRDACLLYFQTFSKKPIPKEYEKPENPLKYYQEIELKYLPGS